MTSANNMQQPQVCLRKSFAVVKASGENILTYLQGQISQDTQQVSNQQAIYSAILTAQGKLITDFHLLQAQNNEVIFICPSASALTLVERLRRFALGYELRIGMLSSWQVWSIQGQGVDDYLAEKQLPIPQTSALATAHQADVHSMRFAEAADDGVWVVGEKVEIQSNVDENSIIQQRICQGMPMFGVDLDDKIFPLNANLIERQGVSFDKGCYVGQEVTSRMHWRGGIKKKLYRVQLDKAVSTLPCPIFSSAKVGMLSSLASNTQGEHLGIALLPIEVAEKNSSLTAEGDIPLTVLGVCV
ncbi:MAG: folate-binding protein [Mariprofundaceae bacterium]|nr:folate-binding protein [Mariprofundaceae bacterium]